MSLDRLYDKIIQHHKPPPGIIIRSIGWGQMKNKWRRIGPGRRRHVILLTSSPLQSYGFKQKAGKMAMKARPTAFLGKAALPDKFIL